MTEAIGTIKTEAPARIRAGAAVTILAAAVVLGAALVTAGCNKKKQPPAKAKPVNVTVRTVEPISDFVDTFFLPGVVEPNRVVQVCAEVAATIERFDCREGVSYKAGKDLIYLDTELLKPEHDRASVQQDFDKADMARVRKLHDRGLATLTEMDQANARWLTSKAAFEAADAKLRRAVIKAPVTGVLNRLPKEEGEYVSPGECVAEIVDIDTAKVVVHVPERDVPFIKKHRKENIFVGPNDNRRLVGEIKYISELAHPEALTTRVELEVKNTPPAGPDGKRPLRSGQIVRVRLTRRILKDVIMVPLAAVIPLEKGHAIYVVEDGRAVRRNVTLGLIKADRIRVVNGLRTGDRLIISGHQYVGPGQKVDIRSPVAPSTMPSTSRAAAKRAQAR
ncbi:MAG: efflux RND transporter periplasmic adaptor subunit [Phycisphaerae bacterium]|nr:efflux RND transporter periplasmic adaptor subunit [Phycisphaerae bacterium]